MRRDCICVRRHICMLWALAVGRSFAGRSCLHGRRGLGMGFAGEKWFSGQLEQGPCRQRCAGSPRVAVGPVTGPCGQTSVSLAVCLLGPSEPCSCCGPDAQMCLEMPGSGQEVGCCCENSVSPLGYGRWNGHHTCLFCGWRWVGLK